MKIYCILLNSWAKKLTKNYSLSFSKFNFYKFFICKNYSNSSAVLTPKLSQSHHMAAQTVWRPQFGLNQKTDGKIEEQIGQL